MGAHVKYTHGEIDLLLLDKRSNFEEKNGNFQFALQFKVKSEKMNK